MQIQRQKIPYLILIPLILVPLYTVFIAPMFIIPRFALIAATLIGQAVLWAAALAVIVGVIYVEKRPLASIGWQAINLKWVAIALGIGILLSLLVPLLTLLIASVVPASDDGTIAQVTESVPVWLLFISIVTAAITEEILYRGYLLERLIERTGSLWLSAAISVIFFVLVHISGWNWQHVLGVVLPLGIILTGLYLWRRNLIFVIIVHFMINLPLVLLAAAG